MNLCQYKDLFGKPNTGLHSVRVFNIAIVDLSLTMFISAVIAYYIECKFIPVFIIVLLISLVIHKLFCVETTLTKLV